LERGSKAGQAEGDVLNLALLRVAGVDPGKCFKLSGLYEKFIVEQLLLSLAIATE